ncbi:hypothetical protein EVAR_63664_1 [Eumeta japonica]|uniref:Uncharacterized protein n=1 Tax=Eumeta variegata TaxID=151549 RepID=A0A4C2AEU3_EUMVA|nr:hypothetical protein EVAR_63664_1 [Eumeta japonica]
MSALKRIQLTQYPENWHQKDYNNIQLGFMVHYSSQIKTSTTNRALDAHEMEEAMNIIKIVQAAIFGEELERLSLKTPVHKSSLLASLNPFLDEC